MPEVASIHPAIAPWIVLVLLAVGAWLAATLDHAVRARIAGRSVSGALAGPFRTAALLLRQDTAITERPDVLLWILAPASYAAVAAAALCVVPLGEGVAIADVRTGIVAFGAAEALAIVAIFMHGWASNSHLSLVGGYRFVALGLSYELLSMFVLIAAALPAESLQLSAIVDAQQPLWNVIRQPLGLPLWVVVTWGITLRGPLALADARDLAGGTSAEASGRQRLLWEAARGGMLLVFCAMGAAVFLGGWRGPVLPGPLWMALKTALLMVVVVALGHRLGRLPTERAVKGIWTILLPLSFIHLALAGVEALL